MRCRFLSVSSAIAAPLAVGNFQTVMVAMDFSFDGLAPKPVGVGSGVEDLTLLELELGVVEDAGVAQLAQLAELRQLGVGVGARRRLLRRSLLLRSLLGLGLGALFLSRPLVRLAARDAVGHGGGRAG